MNMKFKGLISLHSYDEHDWVEAFIAGPGKFADQYPEWRLRNYGYGFITPEVRPRPQTSGNTETAFFGQ